MREESPTWGRRIDGALAGRVWMSPYFDPLMPEFEHEFHNGPSNRAGSMLVTADPAMQADDVALLDATR